MAIINKGKAPVDSIERDEILEWPIEILASKYGRRHGVKINEKEARSYYKTHYKNNNKVGTTSRKCRECDLFLPASRYFTHRECGNRLLAAAERVWTLPAMERRCAQEDKQALLDNRPSVSHRRGACDK